MKKLRRHRKCWRSFLWGAIAAIALYIWRQDAGTLLLPRGVPMCAVKPRALVTKETSPRKILTCPKRYSIIP